MARKGKDAEVQVFVKTEEEWERLLEPQVLRTAHHHVLLHSRQANCCILLVPIFQDYLLALLLQGVLTVVDVYTEWAGPCNAMANYLKKIKLEVEH